MFDLTIAIPTYNRSRYLEQLLAKIIPVCLGKKVEVLVSDNASTDATPEVLSKFSGHSFFRGLRNESNLGFDRNILKLLDEARGRFVWLFGDDDDLELSLFDQILNLVRSRSDVGLFFLSFSWKSEVDQPKSSSKLVAREISQQRYLDDYLHQATFITSNIINKQYYRQINLDPDCVTKEWINIQILVNLAGKLNELQKTNLVVMNGLVFPAIGNTQYSPEHFWDLFVKRFAFTVDRSNQTLSLQKFKENFYRLNIRRRFLTLGRDFSDKRVIDIYQRVSKYFSPPVIDRVLFWLSLTAFRLFGYSTLKRLKSLLSRRGK